MLNTSKVVAGGLAAATAALVGSYFGVLGTVGAAGATSVVTALSTEIYQRSLDRTASRLRGQGGYARSERTPRAHPGPPAERSAGRSVLPGVVIGSLVIFAVGVGLVSVGEYARGAPLSGGSGGTSVGELVHGTLHPVVGNLLGPVNQPDNSDQENRHSDRQQEPGLIDGLLSGL
jgi:hypothetical protein